MWMSTQVPGEGESSGADVDLALRDLDVDERQLAGVSVEDLDDLAGDNETHGQFLHSRPP